MTNAELIEALKDAERYMIYVAPSCYASCEAIKAIRAAADALEADEKRIAELEAQLPKEGKWIDMGDFEMCSVCKIAQRKKYRQYHGGFMWVKTDFCPLCGSRMRKGEQE